MPTKRRTKIRTSKPKFNEELIRLFMKCEEISESGDDEMWEEDGGRRAEWRNASSRLFDLFHLAPWQQSPLDMTEENPPAWMTYGPHRVDWREAWELRQRLLDAVAELEVRDRALLVAKTARTKKRN